MTRLGLAALALPVFVLVACQKPAPPPAAPVLTPAEAACAAQAAQIAAVDISTVTVVPSTTTKTGATVYTATAGGKDYMCVVEIDQSVSAFEVLTVPQ